MNRSVAVVANVVANNRSDARFVRCQAIVSQISRFMSTSSSLGDPRKNEMQTVNLHSKHEALMEEKEQLTNLGRAKRILESIMFVRLSTRLG